MGLIVSELYDALIEAGVTPESAKAAAGALPSAESMATKDDIAALKEEIARLATANKDDLAKLAAANREEAVKLAAANRDDLAKLAAANREETVRLTAANREEAVRLTTANREAIGKLESRLVKVEKQLAVLNVVVFTFGSGITALLTKLVFFP